MNKQRLKRHKEHLKVHEYFYEDCELCQDRLNMCFDGEDHQYDEHDSDCCICGC